MKTYPKILFENGKEVIEFLRYVNKERPNDVRDMSNLSNNFLNGHSSNTGSVTLTAGVTTTVVNNQFIRENGAPILVPMTANAALEMNSGNLYISAVADGSFTITHTNAAFVDRTFRYVVVGI